MCLKIYSIELVKGVNIQKNHVLMFDPIEKNSADEHQPFQPQMVSKLVSIEKAKDCDYKTTEIMI